MELVADLHLHSKYSRAVSPKMVISEMAKWAKKKGIGLVGTTDWTHPLWLKEIATDLVEVGEGVFAWKEDLHGPKFILVTEISSIFTQGGKGRRIHTLVFAPNFSTVEKINDKLRARGANLLSDGRPMTGLPVKELAEIVFSVSRDCLVIPSHAWTPYFGIYGDKGGFDSLEEAFGAYTKNIYAIETGLSSDPAMNWRVKELDNRAILSFSDAHSLQKLGREATVFNLKFKIENLKFKDIVGAIKNDQNSNLKISYTIEFYPEEGKYHYTGHRNCQVKRSPDEVKRWGETCPVCGKQLTVGVMQRVEELATRSKEEVKGESWEVGQGLRGVKWGKRPPYVMLVPLAEILAEALESSLGSQKVSNEYDKLTGYFDSELAVLLNIPVSEIEKISGLRVAEGIKKVRQGEIVIDPGCDGVFGTVKIWESSKVRESEATGGAKGEQTTLF